MSGLSFVGRFRFVLFQTVLYWRYSNCEASCDCHMTTLTRNTTYPPHSVHHTVQGVTIVQGEGHREIAHTYLRVHHHHLYTGLWGGREGRREGGREGRREERGEVREKEGG